MSTEIKVWEVANGSLASVSNTCFATTHTEDQLEEWICQSPDILGEDLLIIARQLSIAGVGRLDLLGMDGNGQLVIIELKRDLSPREVVAQALDYASWLNTAGADEIRATAKEYLGCDLADKFRELFHTEPPDWLCENHRILIVAARLDSSSERIISYLADKHSVPINAIFFNYAKLFSGKEILVRSVLVDEQIASIGKRGTTARPSESTLLGIAADRNTIGIVECCRKLGDIWREERTNTSGGSFRYWTDKPNGGPKMVFGVNVSGTLADAPIELAAAPIGQLDVWLRIDALAEVTGIPEETIRRDVALLKRPFRTAHMDFVLRLDSIQIAEELVEKLRNLVNTSSATAMPLSIAQHE